MQRLTPHVNELRNRYSRRAQFVKSLIHEPHFSHEIQLSFLIYKLLFEFLCDAPFREDSLKGTLWFVIFLLKRTSNTLFGNEFSVRVEEVAEPVRVRVHILYGSDARIPAVPPIPDDLSDSVGVFLLDKTIIVFAFGSASGKGNTFFFAPSQKAYIDEL